MSRPYADPAAPKGGMVRFGAQGGFDNFNIVVAGLKGDLENGIQQIYDPLMTESPMVVSTKTNLPLSPPVMSLR